MYSVLPSRTGCVFLSRVLASGGKDLKGSVFLEALAGREEAKRNGKMTVSERGREQLEYILLHN